MKKFILVLAVSCLGFATQAQTVTKIYARCANQSEVELTTPGDTFYYKGELRNLIFKLSFEFTNGGNQLNENDSVIIGAKLTTSTYGDGYGPYTINGKTYDAYLFKVPSGGIAPNELHKFVDDKGQAVTPTGVNGQTGKTSANAKCMYVSTYGHLKDAAAPAEITRDFYLIQDKTSVSEAALAAVKLFPTLVSDELKLSNLVNTDVAIYSLVGQQMLKYSDQTGNIAIDVSSLANGIYFVKIQSGGAVRTEKIKIVR